MSAIAWGILVIGALLSVASFNPVPFALCLVVALTGSAATKKEVAAVKAAGRNPDLPPAPTNGTGLLGCVLWVILWAVLLTVAGIAVFGIIIGGI